MDEKKRQIADEIYRTCSLLNQLLVKASDQDLQVEIDVHDVSTWGKGAKELMLSVKVFEYVPWPKSV